MISKVDMEFIFLLMELNIKVILLKVNLMDKVNLHINLFKMMILHNLMDHGLKASPMAKALLLIKTEINIKVIL